MARRLRCLRFNVDVRLALVVCLAMAFAGCGGNAGVHSETPSTTAAEPSPVSLRAAPVPTRSWWDGLVEADGTGRYGVSSRRGPFRYGTTFQPGEGSAGEFRLAREAWGEWDAGIARLRTVVREQELTHTLGASYLPGPELTVAPTVSFKEERRPGTQVETPSVALALIYAPRAAFNITAQGLYSRTQSSDGLLKSNEYQLKSVFTWSSFRTIGLDSTLSLDAGYKAAVDNLRPVTPVEDVSGMVRLQLHGF